jgi:hypothetical protein
MGECLHNIDGFLRNIPLSLFRNCCMIKPLIIARKRKWLVGA